MRLVLILSLSLCVYVCSYVSGNTAFDPHVFPLFLLVQARNIACCIELKDSDDDRAVPLKVRRQDLHNSCNRKMSGLNHCTIVDPLLSKSGELLCVLIFLS